MTSRTRYQGAIIRDHQVLLLKQIEHASGRSYWQIPGGRIEPDETEEQCVQREMREETGLEVQIDALLLDEPSPSDSIYQRWKTYRCTILAGEALPGSEPEADYANAYSFTEVGWFDLQYPATWDARLGADSYIAAWLQRIQAALGYAVASSPPEGTSRMASQFLPIDTILTILQETPPRLAKLTAGLTPAQLHTAPSVGAWSANEVLAHLRACQEVWGGYYMLTILAQDRPTIKAINPRTWIQHTDYLEQAFHAALRAFTEQRSKLLTVLEPLPPEDWMRTNTLIGAGKPLQQTLLSHADGLARHERAHLKQIERTLKALQ